jgi:hypothetical protein
MKITSWSNALVLLDNEWTCTIVNHENGYALRNVIMSKLVIKYDEITCTN